MSARVSPPSDTNHGLASKIQRHDADVQSLSRDLNAAVTGVAITPRVHGQGAEHLRPLSKIIELLNVTYRGETNDALVLSDEIESDLRAAERIGSHEQIPPLFRSALQLCQSAGHSARLDYDAARTRSESALQLAIESGNADQMVACQLQSARDAYQSGHLTESIEMLASIGSQPEISGSNTATMHGYLGELSAHYRLLSSVDEHLVKALETEPGFGAILQFRFSGAYITILNMTGRSAEARDRLNHLRESEQARTCSLATALLDIAEAGLCQAAGDTAAAEVLTAKGIEAIEESGNTYHLTRAQRARASVLARLGRSSEALELLSQSEHSTMGDWARRPALELRLAIARNQERWQDAVRLQRRIRDHDRVLRRDLARIYSLLARSRPGHDLENARRALEVTNGQLVQARSERERLLHIVAHDLKSPLNALDLTLDFVAHVGVKQTDLVNRLESATEITGRIQKIAAQLSALHDLESHAFSVSEESLDVEVALQQILRDYESSAQQKRITFDVSVAQSVQRPVLVCADNAKLLQVFDNLVSNSLKYSYPGSRVAIAIGRAADTAQNQGVAMMEIRITDTGQGLTESDQRLVFGKYSRLSATPTAGEASSGIGLYIAHSFASAMGGDLSVESEGKDLGATFRLVLPAALPGAQGEA